MRHYLWRHLEDALLCWLRDYTGVATAITSAPELPIIVSRSAARLIWAWQWLSYSDKYKEDNLLPDHPTSVLLDQLSSIWFYNSYQLDQWSQMPRWLYDLHEQYQQRIITSSGRFFNLERTLQRVGISRRERELRLATEGTLWLPKVWRQLIERYQLQERLADWLASETAVGVRTHQVAVVTNDSAQRSTLKAALSLSLPDGFSVIDHSGTRWGELFHFNLLSRPNQMEFATPCRLPELLQSLGQGSNSSDDSPPPHQISIVQHCWQQLVATLTLAAEQLAPLHDARQLQCWVNLLKHEYIEDASSKRLAVGVLASNADPAGHTLLHLLTVEEAVMEAAVAAAGAGATVAPWEQLWFWRWDAAQLDTADPPLTNLLSSAVIAGWDTPFQERQRNESYNLALLGYIVEHMPRVGYSGDLVRPAVPEIPVCSAPPLSSTPPSPPPLPTHLSDRYLQLYCRCPQRAYLSQAVQLTPSQPLAVWSQTGQIATAAMTRRLLVASINYLWQQLGGSNQLIALSVAQREELLWAAIAAAYQRLPTAQAGSQAWHGYLYQLLTHYLAFEQQRTPFQVVTLNQNFTVELAGVPITVHIDRIDQLLETDCGHNHGYSLISYQWGRRSWALPTPWQWTSVPFKDPTIPLCCVVLQIGHPTHTGDNGYHSHHNQQSPLPIAYCPLTQIEIWSLATPSAFRRQVYTLNKIDQLACKRELIGPEASVFDWWQKQLTDLVRSMQVAPTNAAELAAVVSASAEEYCRSCPFHNCCQRTLKRA